MSMASAEMGPYGFLQGRGNFFRHQPDDDGDEEMDAAPPQPPPPPQQQQQARRPRRRRGDEEDEEQVEDGDEADVQSLGDMASPPPPPVPCPSNAPASIGKSCCFWQWGYCKFASQCRYQHHAHEFNTLQRPHAPPRDCDDDEPQYGGQRRGGAGAQRARRSAVPVAAALAFERTMAEQRAALSEARVAALEAEVGHLRHVLGHAQVMAQQAAATGQTTPLLDWSAAAAYGAPLPQADQGQLHRAAQSAPRQLVKRAAQRVQTDAKKQASRARRQQEQQAAAEALESNGGVPSSSAFHRSHDASYAAASSRAAAAASAASVPGGLVHQRIRSKRVRDESVDVAALNADLDLYAAGIPVPVRGISLSMRQQPPIPTHKPQEGVDALNESGEAGGAAAAAAVAAAPTSTAARKTRTKKEQPVGGAPGAKQRAARGRSKAKR